MLNMNIMKSLLDQMIDYTAESLQQQAVKIRETQLERTQTEKQKKIAKFKLAFTSALYTEVLKGLIEDHNLIYECENPINEAKCQLNFEGELLSIEFDANLFKIIWHSPIENQSTDWIEPKELQNQLLSCLATIRLSKKVEQERTKEFMENFKLAHAQVEDFKIE